jgi:hypothetical protein
MDYLSQVYGAYEVGIWTIRGWCVGHSRGIGGGVGVGRGDINDVFQWFTRIYVWLKLLSFGLRR